MLQTYGKTNIIPICDEELKWLFVLSQSSVSEESFLIMNLIQFLIRIIGCFESTAKYER